MKTTEILELKTETVFPTSVSIYDNLSRINKLKLLLPPPLPLNQLCKYVRIPMKKEISFNQLVLIKILLGLEPCLGDTSMTEDTVKKRSVSAGDIDLIQVIIE